MHRFLVISIILSSAILSCANSLLAAPTTWPIKKFKVVEAKKGFTDYIMGYESPFQGALDPFLNNLSAEEEKQIEDWLEKVANYYEALGFLPPLYTVKTEDESAFIVYAYPFGKPTEPSARSLFDCAKPDGESYIQVSPGRIVTNGQLAHSAYQTLAHELFHTVQYSYPLFNKNCDTIPGAWLLEGTAEAIGINTARRIASKRPKDCQIGQRLYSEHLYVEKWNTPSDSCGLRSYATASFWHYLAQFHHSARPKADDLSPADFTYLQKFFERKLALNGQYNEITWLDRALDEDFGFKLNRGYAGFVSTYAAYYKKRLPNFYTGNYPSDEANRADNWLKAGFGKCEQVLATKPGPVLIPSQPIEAVAARCIDLVPDFNGQTTFWFNAEGNKDELTSLMISTSDGRKRETAKLVTSGPKAGKKATFKFTKNFVQDESHHFIISNVAEKAGKTKKRNPLLSIVFNTGQVSLATPKTKKPPKPSSNPVPSGAETGQGTSMSASSRGPGKHVALGEMEITQGYETQNWFTQVRQIDRPPCDDAFVRRACGPQTAIALSLSPDIIEILNEATQPNMAFERMADVLGGILRRGPLNVQSDVTKAAMEMSKQDASTIRIRIPRIDYGFKGSFDNAHISANKAVDDEGRDTGSYRAIGPEMIGLCGHDGYYPLSGKVTITEASPDVLKGTFSAGLVDSGNRVGSCETLPIANNISGSFSVPNPRLNNEKEEVDPHKVVEDVIKKTNEAVPGLITGDMRDYIDSEVEKKLKEKAARKAAKEEAKSKLAEMPCSCDCFAAMNTIPKHPQCFVECENELAKCKYFDAMKSIYETKRTPTSAEASELGELRKRFGEELSNRGLPEDAIKQQLEAFDQLPGYSFKKQLVESFLAQKK